MMDAWWQADCLAINEKVKAEAEDRQEILTKPPGSLGRLEEIAITLAGLYGDNRPEIKKPLITIFAADHGVVAQGVSAFPQAVTVEMVRNFLKGGAAISVLAQCNQSDLNVVNCGTAFDVYEEVNLPAESEQCFHDQSFHDQRLLDTPIAAGTADLSIESAMTEAQLEQALAIGQKVIDQALQDGNDVFIAGEMGIGNTTSASALGCAYLNQSAEVMTGRGTGIDDKTLIHKTNIIEQALARLKSDDEDLGSQNPEAILQELGGFEIAAMVGAYIRCAQLGIPVLVDGFITTAAALAAYKMNPQVIDWLLFSHQSQEQGHRYLLGALHAKPLLDLDLRLGEGSGAATVLPLLRQSCALHTGMATFAEAAISAEKTES